MIAAHRQLDAAIVLIWDTLGTHICADMRRFIDNRDWLTVVQLPVYAPELNAVEGVWSLLRRGSTARSDNPGSTSVVATLKDLCERYNAGKAGAPAWDAGLSRTCLWGGLRRIG